MPGTKFKLSYCQKKKKKTRDTQRKPICLAEHSGTGLWSQLLRRLKQEVTWAQELKTALGNVVRNRLQKQILSFL
jgi:hypothetical protein